jgi:hypothetical protein
MQVDDGPQRFIRGRSVPPFWIDREWSTHRTRALTLPPLFFHRTGSRARPDLFFHFDLSLTVGWYNVKQAEAPLPRPARAVLRQLLGADHGVGRRRAADGLQAGRRAVQLRPVPVRVAVGQQAGQEPRRRPVPLPPEDPRQPPRLRPDPVLVRPQEHHRRRPAERPALLRRRPAVRAGDQGPQPPDPRPPAVRRVAQQGQGRHPPHDLPVRALGHPRVRQPPRAVQPAVDVQRSDEARKRRRGPSRRCSPSRPAAPSAR